MPPFLLCAKLLQLGLMKYMDIWEKRTLMRPGSPMIFGMMYKWSTTQGRDAVFPDPLPRIREREILYFRGASVNSWLPMCLLGNKGSRLAPSKFIFPNQTEEGGEDIAATIPRTNRPSKIIRYF
ncbi:uncharacterized protein LOC143835330 isoform X2 [Paroedura picta]|uniref:uncharacterized protein LOC143835330 isoform X2 n=1 Tax=Paroedura picta TaxID=143630 RepID=UPI00405626E4